MTWITPRRSSLVAELAEIRASAGLLYFMVWRDLKVRYRQTALGVAWSVLQPAGLAVVFAVFLGRLADVPSDALPYGLFALAGLTPWTFFANGVEAATSSLTNNASLVTKVYFPRAVLPLSATLGFLPDLAIMTVIVLGYALASSANLGLGVLLMPPAVVWTALVTLGTGGLLGALNVRYRDVRHGLRFLLQVWLFASPVAYSWTLVPARWQLVYGANPLAGPIALFRTAVTGEPLPPGRLLAASSVTSLTLLVLAVVEFRRTEASFADVI